MATLSAAAYGKDLVRVFRVVRRGGGEGQQGGVGSAGGVGGVVWSAGAGGSAGEGVGAGGEAVHDVAEYEVRVMVEGDIATSYTQGDNSVVVATDSMKNIVYYVAKTSPYVLAPELFALHIGTFLLGKYAHLARVRVEVARLRWARIAVGPAGAPHGHAFQRDGAERRLVWAEVVRCGEAGDAADVQLEGGLEDLLVLKSTGSAFAGFVRDEFTTLREVGERVFATEVALRYAFPRFVVPLVGGLGGLEGRWGFERAAGAARAGALEVFATDESASVQATLFKMGERLLAAHGDIARVSYVLPNKHYIPVDMGYLGLENLEPSAADVFVPQAAPSGRISATVSRATE